MAGDRDTDKNPQRSSIASDDGSRRDLAYDDGHASEPMENFTCEDAIEVDDRIDGEANKEVSDDDDEINVEDDKDSTKDDEDNAEEGDDHPGVSSSPAAVVQQQLIEIQTAIAHASEARLRKAFASMTSA